MDFRYLLFVFLGLGGAALGITIYNYLFAYIRRNKGQEKNPTLLNALLFREMSVDAFLFIMIFPHKSLVGLFQDSWWDSAPRSIFGISFVLFMFADLKIRHSIQKKKMAKGEKGFLEYYDLRNPLEKENPGALTTKIK